MILKIILFEKIFFIQKILLAGTALVSGNDFKEYSINSKYQQYASCGRVVQDPSLPKD